MTRARNESTTLRIVQTLWFPTLVLVGWQLASSREWINSFFFPPPTRVLAQAWDMTTSGELVSQLASTLRRYSMGVTIGCLSGIACGLWMGVSTISRRALGPLVAALYSTPKLALLPLVMLLLGIGDVSKVALISLVGFIFLASQTFDAIRGVDVAYVESAINHRADLRRLILRVYAPAVLPQIFTGLRMALTRSLVVAISIELVSGLDGIGSIIWQAWETLATERLYVSVALAASMGISMHWLVSLVEDKLVPWRGSKR